MPGCRDACVNIYQNFKEKLSEIKCDKVSKIFKNKAKELKTAAFLRRNISLYALSDLRYLIYR